MNETTNLPHLIRPMSLERVHFFDGMILSADDLEAEREYHLARSRLINRAVFGCGIACGLEVRKHPLDEKQTRFICIKPGIAFDCHGDPLELCRPVKLNLDPDPCKEPPGCVCILIRRRDGKPRGSGPCGNSETADERTRRVREEIEIRVVNCASAFEGVCRIIPEQDVKYDAGDCDDNKPRPKDPKDKLCDCLKMCESCEDCDEGWILLACVKLEKPRQDDNEGCKDSERDRWVIKGDIDNSGRKYIKPIHCHCRHEKQDEEKDPKDDCHDSETDKSKGEKEPTGSKGQSAG